MAMKKVKGQYYVVPKFVIDGLGLESGPMRDIYAIIYGFSQDGESACECNVQYFMDWTMASERTVRSIISDLAHAGYILRTEIGTGRGSYVEYRANMDIVAEIEKGAKFAPIEKGANRNAKGCKSAQKRVQNLHPDNNIIIYNNYFLRDARTMEEQKRELFNFFFWKNSNNPKAEVEAFCRVAELNEWKDSKGRKLDTFRKRIIWADGWEMKNGKDRVNPYFLAMWNEIYKELLRTNDPMAERIINTLISVKSDAKNILLECPQEVIDWIEGVIVPQGRSSKIYNLITSFMKGRKLHYQPLVL